MKNAVSEKALVVLEYLKENDGANLTVADIAEAVGMEVKSAGPVITAGLQRKNLTVRVPATIETEDGIKEVKFVQLTDAGRAYDHDAAIAKDAEEAAAKAAEKAAAKADAE